jgi:hypothetical protein
MSFKGCWKLAGSTKSQAEGKIKSMQRVIAKKEAASIGGGGGRGS